MNGKLFSDAMSELDSRYVEEALCYASGKTARRAPRRWTVMLIAALVALFLLGAGCAVTIFEFEDFLSSADPFETVTYHELSEDGPIQGSVSIDSGELFLVPEAMKTNSAAISVINHGAAQITVYLYISTAPETPIRQLRADANETVTFDGLSHCYLYSIGITGETGGDYPITIQD